MLRLLFLLAVLEVIRVYLLFVRGSKFTVDFYDDTKTRLMLAQRLLILIDSFDSMDDSFDYKFGRLFLHVSN